MRTHSRLALVLIVLASIVVSGCVEGGIGMTPGPSTGARWSGPGPDVFVGGGPVYR